MTGASFLYEIRLDGGWLFIAVALMDRADEPEKLFMVGDTTEGWTTVQRFIMALESSGLKSLQPRPLERIRTGKANYAGLSACAVRSADC
jgi:hypothetical protein